MLCPECKKEMPDNYNFCPKCGKTVGPIPQRETKISIPTGVMILAILELISGIILVILALAVGAVTIKGEFSFFGQIAVVIGEILTAILAVAAVFSFVMAGALLSGKKWARTLVVILSIIDVIFEAASIVGGNPFGIGVIILDIIVLYYMWRPNTIAYFKRA